MSDIRNRPELCPPELGPEDGEGERSLETDNFPSGVGFCQTAIKDISSEIHPVKTPNTFNHREGIHSAEESSAFSRISPIQESHEVADDSECIKVAEAIEIKTEETTEQSERCDKLEEPISDSLGSLKLAPDPNEDEGNTNGDNLDSTASFAIVENGNNAIPDFMVDKEGDTLLHVAIINGVLLDTLCGILDHYMHYDSFEQFINYANRLRQTALHLAVLTKQAKLVKLLVELGAKTDARDMCLRTPMLTACELGRPDLLEPFFDSDLPPNPAHLDIVNDKGESCLHTAVELGDHEMAQLLIQNGANINISERKGGRTPLHLAAEAGNVEMVKLLLSFKELIDCDIRTYGKTGDTALELAYMRDRKEVMELLKPVSDPIRKRKQKSEEDDEGD